MIEKRPDSAKFALNSHTNAPYIQSLEGESLAHDFLSKPCRCPETTTHGHCLRLHSRRRGGADPGAHAAHICSSYLFFNGFSAFRNFPTINIRSEIRSCKVYWWGDFEFYEKLNIFSRSGESCWLANALQTCCKAVVHVSEK